MGRWDDPAGEPLEAPEACVMCHKPLTEVQMEAGQITCSDLCAKDYHTTLASEAEAEAKWLQEERELEMHGHISYSIPPLVRQVNDIEGDLLFDANREFNSRR